MSAETRKLRKEKLKSEKKMGRNSGARKNLRVLTEEEIKKQEPKKWEKAKNFSGAMFRILVQKLKGNDVYVSEEELQSRLDICSRCQYLGEKKNKYYCRAKTCGCNITKEAKWFINKAGLKTENCPKGFWEKYREN